MQDKTPESNLKYKKYKNKLTTVIRFAEKNFYAEKFEMAKGNIRKRWLIIKHIANRPDLSDKNPIKEMKINNKIVTDHMTIANELNKFFTNIGPKLAKEISNVDGDISDCLDGSFQNSLCAIHTDQLNYKI